LISYDMPYRSLGRCGTKVSAFGLGGWMTFGNTLKDAAQSRAIVRHAFDAGVNFFDLADVYAEGEAERLMGKALAGLPRRRLVISSKAFFPMSGDVNDRGLSRKHIMESVHDSLRRIGTDYLDLYFCHRFDAATPLEETVRAMDDLVRQGKVVYWATSDWTGEQMREAARLCGGRGFHRPQVEQPCYNLLTRFKVEKDVRPAAEELGLGLVTFSPLASGLLTGKYDDGLPKGSRLERVDWLKKLLYKEGALDKIRAFKAVADGLGRSRAEVALAWAAAQPGVSSVILGASRLEQLKDNLKALSLSLPDDALRELDRIFPAEG
jgi:voltage-dependent potassium channel beta subunit